MSIEFKGIDNIIDRLDAIADTSNVEDALTKCCMLVERSAKQKAPKENGDLRRSITSQVIGLTGEVYTPLDYAPYVEYGTGIHAEDGKGRQNVPWVYVEGSSKKSTSSKTYTVEEAEATVEFLRSKGLDAHMTYGRHPTPYMRPALYENEEQIKEILLRGAMGND